MKDLGALAVLGIRERPCHFWSQKGLFRPPHRAHDWMMVMAETDLNQLRTYMYNDYACATDS